MLNHSNGVLPRQSLVFSILQTARIFLIIALLLFFVAIHFFSWSLPLPFLLLLQALAFYALGIVLLAYFQKRGISLMRLIEYSLLLDVLVLTELLMFTGGSSNPLTFLYVLPILTSALICSRRFARILSALAIGAYLLLFFLHWPFPVVSDNARSLLNIHLAGMWLSFAFSTILITLWVSNLANAIRTHERKLAQAHKKQQEKEYWLSLGMEAAGMAHHLSTPLNNMILLSEEITNDTRLPEHLRSDMALLDIQLAECTGILSKLKTHHQADLQQIPLYATLEAHLAQWHNLRPDARCVWQRREKNQQEQYVLLDETFWLAFVNILNNAADAGDSQIDLYTEMHDEYHWEIGIHNRSGYLSPSQLNKAGLDILESEKPSGLGLGVRLSHATLSRLSGSLTLENHAQGGVFAKIIIPLKKAEI